MTDEDKALQAAQLGIDVESFLRSNAGKYLLHRADEHTSRALDALLLCSPTDVELNYKYRLQAFVGEKLKEFLQSIVNEGYAATKHLQELEEGVD